MPEEFPRVRVEARQLVGHDLVLRGIEQGQAPVVPELGVGHGELPRLLVAWFAAPVVQERVVVREAHELDDVAVGALGETEQFELRGERKLGDRLVERPRHLREVAHDTAAAGGQQREVGGISLLHVVPEDSRRPAGLPDPLPGAPLLPVEDGATQAAPAPGRVHRTGAVDEGRPCVQGETAVGPGNAVGVEPGECVAAGIVLRRAQRLLEIGALLHPVGLVHRGDALHQRVPAIDVGVRERAPRQEVGERRRGALLRLMGFVVQRGLLGRTHDSSVLQPARGRRIPAPTARSPQSAAQDHSSTVDSGPQDDDLVEERGLARIMRHQEDRMRGQPFAEVAEQCTGSLGVQMRGGFVQQDHGRTGE